MSIVIKKAKIKRDLFLESEYIEYIEDGSYKEIKDNSTAPVHDDLKKAFRLLTIHAAILSEQVKGKGDKGVSISEHFPDDEFRLLIDPEGQYKFSPDDWSIIDKMYVSGFVITGSGDTEGVMLIANRTLSNEKGINIITPIQKWEDYYKHSSDLSEVVELCRSEVHQYLFKGKHQPDNQLDLFEEEEAIEGVLQE